MRCVRDPGGDVRFAGRQQAYFSGVDVEKFQWQIGPGFFAQTEQRLVTGAGGRGRLLEVGCGEGGNLFHLGRRDKLTVGVDFAFPKVVFAARQIPWSGFVCANAVELPFATGSFERVLCRDVLHHLTPAQQKVAVTELFRVCRSAEGVVLIEPNGRNPLMLLFALLVPAERGALRSTPAALDTLVRSACGAMQLQMAQPLPIVRALLHYRFGCPGLAHWAAFRAIIRVLDTLCEWAMPRSCWAYIIVSGRQGLK